MRCRSSIYLLAGERVERTERLVHQQQAGILHQRTADRRPLAHSAGQLGRIFLLELGKTDGTQKLARLLTMRRGVELFDLDREEHIAEDRSPVEQHVALKAIAILSTAPLTARLSTSITPVVGGISPAISISKVLLPQPLGPTMDTNSPAPTERSISLRAWTSPPRAAR